MMHLIFQSQACMLCVCAYVLWALLSEKCSCVFDAAPYPLIPSPIFPPPPRARPSHACSDSSNARVCLSKTEGVGYLRRTLNRRPRVARHSDGGGDVLLCYLNTMYVCIYRKTDAPQLYPFPFKGHAARVTWARAYAAIPRRQTIQAGPLFV